MDVDSSAKSWLDIAQTMEVQQEISSCLWQDENLKSSKVVDTPISVFGQFVAAVASNVSMDMSEFSACIRDLCVKAPSIATFLAQEVLNYPSDDPRPEAQRSTESAPGTKRSSKRQLDPTYRLPRSSRAEPELSRHKSADRPSTGSTLGVHDSVTSPSGHDDITITQRDNGLVIEQPLQACEGEFPEIVAQEIAHGEAQSPSSTDGSTMESKSAPSEALEKSTDLPGNEAAGSQGASGVDSLASERAVRLRSADDDMTIEESPKGLKVDNDISDYEEQVPTEAEEAPQGGAEGQSATQEHTLPSTTRELGFYRATCSSDSAKRDEVHRQPSVALDQSTEDIQITDQSLFPGGEEQEVPASGEIDEKASISQAGLSTSLSYETELLETALLASTLSTPIRHIDRGCQSPLSDDSTTTPQTNLFSPIVDAEHAQSPVTENSWAADDRDMAEKTLSEIRLWSPSSTGPQQPNLCHATSTQAQQLHKDHSHLPQDSQARRSSSPLAEVPTLTDMVAKAIDLLHELSKSGEVPTNIHSGILSTLRSGLRETSATVAIVDQPGSERNSSSSRTWSASMWISTLEAGYARANEVTLLNMIDWIGASEWYDAELGQAEKAPPLTKRGAPRKRLATVVLDKYLMEPSSDKAVLSLKTPASEDHDSAVIQKRIFDTRRKRLIDIFYKGRTLRRLIQMTDFGILFDPNIRRHAKASKEEVDNIAALVQSDAQKMKLLAILGEQVRLVVDDGRPDLSRFLDLLESHSIIPAGEVSHLRADYGLEREPVPQEYVNTAIDQVTDSISGVLGEQLLGQGGSIRVNETADLFSGMFDRIRSKAWLSWWDIATALDMTDRPASIKLGHCIPLHEKDTNGKVTTLVKPFRRWRQKIDEYRRDGETDLQGRQIYLCPLNINANHFTLLEINERTKMIHHYDSMAGNRIISRKTKSTLVRKLVEEEFKYLGFGYIEALTPQQKGSWSCGLMVIRNAKRLMMGISVGGWEDEVNPDRVIIRVVENCQRFLEHVVPQSSSISKKRKKSKGIQSTVVDSGRSSKRLKGTTEDSGRGL